jgi:hypothetical protein
VNVSTGASQLNMAMKNLKAQWENIKPDWQDAVQQEFEENHYKPLHERVQLTLREMERLDQVFAKLRRDLG